MLKASVDRRCRRRRAACDCGVGASRQAQQTLFALVPKNTNNPFFDQARDGCKKAEEELKGAVECLYIGPGEHGGGDEQVQIVADLVTKKVDGIAVSPANAPAMAKALQGAKEAGIPVLTWDSRPAARGQGPARRLCRHAQLRHRRQPRQARPGRSSRRAARSASSRAAPRRPTTTSACRASATRSRARRARESPGRPADRPERLDGSRRLPALHQRRLPALGPADGGHPRQVSRPRRLHADRRLPAVPAGRLSRRRPRSTRTRSPTARSRSSSPTRCRCRST